MMNLMGIEDDLFQYPLNLLRGYKYLLQRIKREWGKISQGDIGVIRDSKIKLEDLEVSHTLGRGKGISKEREVDRRGDESGVSGG